MAMIFLLQLSIPVLVKGTGNVGPFVNQLSTGFPSEDIGLDAVCPFGEDNITALCGSLQEFSSTCDIVAAWSGNNVDSLEDVATHFQFYEGNNGVSNTKLLGGEVLTEGSNARLIFGCPVNPSIKMAGNGNYRWCCYKEAIVRTFDTGKKGKKAKSPKSKSSKGQKQGKSANLSWKQFSSAARAQGRAEVGAAVAVAGMIGFIALIAVKTIRRDGGAVSESATATLLADSSIAEATEVTALQM